MCLENTPPSSVVALALCSGSNNQQWELADDGCIPAQTAPLVDYGVADDYRGWYDTQGCGFCRDYCRWVGTTSGGDPALSQLVGTSYWSCALAGSAREFTLPSYFDSWNYTKCSTLVTEKELQRSADAAQDIAVILSTELPTAPRSVPRKPRTPLPSDDPWGSTNVTTDSSESGNDTGTSPNITKMATYPQTTNQVASSVSPNAYAIPLGVIGGILVLAVPLLICFWRRKKHVGGAPKTPLVAAAPVATSDVPRNMAVPSAPAEVPRRVVVIPVADDLPPPYHSIDTTGHVVPEHTR